MFLDSPNPNLASVFRFEASEPRYVNIYHENVNFFKIVFGVFRVAEHESDIYYTIERCMQLI